MEVEKAKVREVRSRVRKMFLGIFIPMRIYNLEDTRISCIELESTNDTGVLGK